MHVIEELMLRIQKHKLVRCGFADAEEEEEAVSDRFHFTLPQKRRKEAPYCQLDLDIEHCGPHKKCPSTYIYCPSTYIFEPHPKAQAL